MPTNINEIAWGELEHAFGSAADLPDLLRALRSGASSARRKALRQLEDKVNHQGLATPAAVAVAPFLVELVEEASTKEHPALLALVADLMVGGSHRRYLAGGFEPPSEGAGRLLYERCAGVCRRAIALLDDRSAAVRAAAAHCLAFIPGAADETCAPVRARARREKNASALASLLLALGLIGRYRSSKEDRELLAEQLAAGKPLVQLAAAASLLCIDAAEPPPEAERTLLDALAGAVEAPSSFPWNGGDLVGIAAAALVEWGSSRSDLELLSRLLAATRDSFANVGVASSLIDRVFDGEEQVDRMRTLAELGALQRSVLERIAGLPAAAGEGVYFALQRHGIHGLPADLRRFLGIDEQGPLDREIGGEPAWKRLRDLRAGRLALDAWLGLLKAELGPAEVVSLCRDAGSGGYALGRRWPWFHVAPEHEQRDFDDLALLLADTLAELADSRSLLDSASALLARPDYAATARALWLQGRGSDAEPDERVDRLAYMAMAYPRTMRDVIAWLPPERRWALVKPLGLGHVVRSSGIQLGGAWHYIDLCAGEEAARQVVSTVAAWDPKADVPHERAVEVLASMGAAARPAVEAALASGETRRRDVLERAHEAL
ncbi:MAG: hypothetical protein JXR96_17285 [Deltaproteobacteria bacterium]|nr:hypothetical protein [Deltaproteobacteria bacterium]